MFLKELHFLNTSSSENDEKKEEEGSGSIVISSPPFLDFVQASVWKKRSEKEVQEMLRHSRGFERAFLGWETNRLGSTPLGEHRTGFEGYFVGTAHSKEEVFQFLLAGGKEIWDEIGRRYPHSYSKRNALEKVIRGESSDLVLVEEWMTILGATLARHRARIFLNKEAQEYRTQVQKKVSTLAPISYRTNSENGLIEQVYSIGREKVSDPLMPSYLNDREELALTTMRNIGAFGHPLLRSAAWLSHTS